MVITPTAKAAGFSGCLRNPKGQSSPQSDSRGRVRVRVLEITARQTAEHLLIAVSSFAVSARAGGVARVDRDHLAGGVLVTLNTRLSPNEIVENSGAELLSGDAPLLELALESLSTVSTLREIVTLPGDVPAG